MRRSPDEDPHAYNAWLDALLLEARRPARRATTVAGAIGLGAAMGGIALAAGTAAAAGWCPLPLAILVTCAMFATVALELKDGGP